MFNNPFLALFNRARAVKCISQLIALVALSCYFSGHLFAMEVPTFNLKNNQWEQLVVPADTSNTSIRELFADNLPAEQYGESWALYSYDGVSNNYIMVGLDDTVPNGAGFWIRQSTGDDVTLDIPDDIPAIPSVSSSACVLSECSSIALQASADQSLFSMLGSGLKSDVMASELRMQVEQQGSDCSDGCNLESAVQSGYISAPLWRWDNESESYVDLSQEGETISPWYAFWLNTQSKLAGANASLLFPISEEPKPDPDPEPEPDPDPEPEPEPEPELFADYRITFDASWSADTHSTRFPADPHFSGLVGAVHNDQVVFWEPGQIASNGIEVMAESGGKSSFLEEIASAIDSGYALSAIDGPGIQTSPDSVSVNIRVTVDNPLVTLTTMIAPSPDWFAGFHGIRLHDGESFVQSVTIDGFAYDSGTDSGASYTSRNDDTQPREPITRTTTDPADSPFMDGLPIVGTFTIEKL